MADEVLARDDNRIPVLAGVTDDANLYVTMLRVDPTTKRLKVHASVTDLIGTQVRAVSAVSVGTSATAIVAADEDLRSFILYNNGSTTVFLGPSGVTTGNGLPLPAGSSFREHNINIVLYGIVATGTEEVRVMKITET